MTKFKTAEEMHAYAKGYSDGMSYDSKWPMTFTYMGYLQNELDEIIAEHQEHEFYSGSQWPEEDMRKLKERQKEVNEARQRREEFRAFLTAKWGSAAHVESSRIMEYYDKVHCPELREEKPAFEIKNKFGVEIKIWANGHVEGIEGTIVNRIPALIAEAKQK